MTITIAVEEAIFGKVYRLLDTMPGVVSLTYHAEGAKTKPNGKAKTPRGSFDISGHDALLAFLYKTHPAKLSDLRAAFEKMGRSPNSIPSLMHALKGEGSIASSPEGYTLTRKARDRLRHRKENA
jgi:hypothetical protein